ncbi:MAG TPA: metallophosphoesterase family protein [Caulifigura sp.]|nr:metallophosphoesterase family protein [Caulifigura sp.]
MRILLVADIHSNWAALSAVREEFDACFVLGDIVDYGCDPVPCIDWAHQHATAAVRGNHDHAVAQRVTPREGGGFRRLAAATRPLHWELIDAYRNKFLSRLPLTLSLTMDGKRFFLVHGSPRDPLDEYLPVEAEAWRARLEGIEADFICVGHTHVPMDLEVDGRRIINPGSVGQPRDGDARAAYAIVEDGEVSFHRVEYDIDAAIEQMRQAGLAEWAVELNEVVLRSGGKLTRADMDRIGIAWGDSAPSGLEGDYFD